MKPFIQIRFLLPAVVIAAALFCLWMGDCRLFTPDQRAYRLYQKGKYSEASLLFENPVWKGVALFKAGEFETAAGIFSGLDSVIATYNQGNCLVFLGRYQEAVQRYDRTIELDPHFEDAHINREIALSRMKALQTEGGEMTGGMLGADDYVFNEGNSSPDAGEEQTNEGAPISDAELQARWLRQVQTKPADFLRSKFAYQNAMEAREDGP